VGGPPLLSLTDFNAAPPGNCADEQLTSEDETPTPEVGLTQISVAIALRATFPFRLAVAKLLNDFDAHGTYEETLRLDAELRTSALHVPFFGPSLKLASYAYSRTVVVENSLRMWYAVCPPSHGARADAAAEREEGRDDLVRLATCGSGFFRTVAMQATLLIAVELRTQVQEAAGLSSPTLRPDLVAVLEDNKAWLLRCTEVDEMNINTCSTMLRECKDPRINRVALKLATLRSIGCYRINLTAVPYITTTILHSSHALENRAGSVFEYCDRYDSLLMQYPVLFFGA
ncbi:hypothetical protein O988_01680, partial [Pseudogymnoascus sp. VKM F-3808]